MAATLAQASAFADLPRLDILHRQFATLGLLALRHRSIGAIEYRRLVVHLRGYDITKFVEERGARVYEDLFRKADLFIANCRHFARRAVELGGDPERIVVIGSPIDCAFFSPAQEGAMPSCPDGTLRIAAVGRLVEKKGFADAIDAVGRLAAMGLDARLEIIGDGPLCAALEDQIAKQELQGRVRLLGAAPSTGVLALLRRADLLIAPSVRAASGDEDAPVNTLRACPERTSAR